MSQFKDQTLLVTGASGHFGRIAVEELLARGATKVIAGTRDPAKLGELEAKGVEIRKLDFDDAGSLGAAFAGVDRVLIISTDGIGKRVAQQTAAVSAAKAAGVKHIVYTSAPAARPNADAGLGVEHFWTEVAIANSGLDFTILRDHMYAENNLADAAHVVASGQLFGLIGDRGTAYVTRADAARTAAGALLTAEGKSIDDVTGPAAITNVERAALYSKITGKPVTSIALPPADLKAGMVAAGLPEGFAGALVAFQVDAVLGFHGVVTDIVERYSGRKPQALESFLTENRTALGA
ncbi:MAG: NAD(P)H-binding protein [Alphaproteobacteria bacterium]|nr:NAD(P)H-binding protein [Alphaproteobacteria bacterium]MBU1561400.1 NAD(P)H-binding protein [Alphaproteobacteria bacterium]MBU2302520.1 NAD(P)H-binding protein [Alphaproteobacteria bacterium]MBU2367508.1 NAD(P)H-binding protein [Alphaproteobacteria bacterium]